MTALQQVQLEPFTEPDLLELEGIAYGAHVLRALDLRDRPEHGSTATTAEALRL